MTAFFQFQLLPIEANIPKKCATVPAFFNGSSDPILQQIHATPKLVDPTPSQESIQQST